MLSEFVFVYLDDILISSRSETDRAKRAAGFLQKQFPSGIIK